MVSTVNAWIDTARTLLAEQDQIPLINDEQIPMGAELYEIWERGDQPLRSAIEDILSRDPDDAAARFVSLNVYYRLTKIDIPQELRAYNEWAKSVDYTVMQEDFAAQLAYLVGLRDVDSCCDAATIRWEIVNFCAVQECESALAACQRLSGLIPADRFNYLLGRLHFLIALRERNTEHVLEYWDLPMGETQQPFRDVWQSVNTIVLYGLGLQYPRTVVSLTDADRDHLRDSMKYLEKAVRVGAPPSALFMLARAYSEIGDHSNAARHYGWMVNHSDELADACTTEVVESLFEPVSASLKSRLHECRTDANDNAHYIDRAISAAEAWITDFPDNRTAYERLARLHQKRGDYRSAYEALREGADKVAALGEDPNVSTILALGGIASPAAMDDMIRDLAKSHAEEFTVAETIMRIYWPVFSTFNAAAQQRWAVGWCLLAANKPLGGSLAVHCFSGVVEAEIRAKIFVPFAGYVHKHQEILMKCTGQKETAEFCRFLSGGGITLGQMFKIISFARSSSAAILSEFANWLKDDHPRFFAGIHRLRTDRIVEFRNRADHADIRTITREEAEKMSIICRELIDLLYAD